MTINIENDFDLNIQKVEELIMKLDKLEDKSKMLCFLNPREFAEIRRM